MKNAIVSVSAALLLAGAGTAFAAMPQAQGQQNTNMQSQTRQDNSMSSEYCPRQLPSFSKVDTQHSGYITEQELAQAMQKADIPTTHLQRDFSHAKMQQSKSGNNMNNMNNTNNNNSSNAYGNSSNHSQRMTRFEYSQWQQGCEQARK